MEISGQLGISRDYMQVDQGEENLENTPDKKDEQLTQRLNLEIGESFLSSIRLMLAWNQRKYNGRSKYEELNTAQNQLISVKIRKKIPTELPVLSISIGNKKFIRTADCNILAKFCYLTKKVVCQLRYEKLSRKVDIPFSDITSLLVCFDHREFDTLRIEARSSLKYFSADKPHPGRFTNWKVEHSNGDGCFPESKFVFLEIEKGMLDKGFAKLLYTDPRLQRTVYVLCKRSLWSPTHVPRPCACSHAANQHVCASPVAIRQCVPLHWRQNVKCAYQLSIGRNQLLDI